MRKAVQLLALSALFAIAGAPVGAWQYPPPNPDRDKCFADCDAFQQSCLAFGGELGGGCGFNHETNECINEATCSFYYD